MTLEAASLNEIKSTLKEMDAAELREQLLRLARFRKENKELLSYILFMEEDKTRFIQDVKRDIDEAFQDIPNTTLYIRTKALRKILKRVNKFIKFSADKMVEAELLIHFCSRMKRSNTKPGDSTALTNLYQRQMIRISKAVSTLHEDLQWDYMKEFRELEL